MIRAELKNYRQSPQKVRLVADLVRGKDVNRALSELRFLDKKASLVVMKLVESAVANAKHNFNKEKEDLFIKEIRVDDGPTLKRYKPGSKGRAFPIKKRTSRVLLSLDEKSNKKEAKKEVKSEKTVKKTTKKTVKAEKKK